MITFANIKVDLTGYLEGSNQSCAKAVINPSTNIKGQSINFVLAFFYALYLIQYKTFLYVLPFSWVKNRTMCGLSENLIITNK